jgi:hypothetical protein
MHQISSRPDIRLIGRCNLKKSQVKKKFQDFLKDNKFLRLYVKKNKRTSHPVSLIISNFRRHEIRYPASPDIRHPTFGFAGYPAKSVSGASLTKTFVSMTIMFLCQYHRRELIIIRIIAATVHNEMVCTIIISMCTGNLQ